MPKIDLCSPSMRKVARDQLDSILQMQARNNITMKINAKQSKLFASLSVYGKYDHTLFSHESPKKYYRLVKQESIHIVDISTTMDIQSADMDSYFFQWTPPLPGTYTLTVNLGTYVLSTYLGTGHFVRTFPTL